MKRTIFIIGFLSLIILAYLLNINEWISLEKMAENREQLEIFVAEKPLSAALLFIAVYIVAVSFSLPGSIFLTLLSGFIFPQPWATLYVVIGATVGATFVFFIAKSAVAEIFVKKAGPKLQAMKKGFSKNAANYLLFLRLVPLFPFWLVNLAPAVFQVPLSTFIWTTFIGIIPGAFAFSQAGTGLHSVFAHDQPLSLSSLINKEVKIALTALGILALLPIFLKKIWKNND